MDKADKVAKGAGFFIATVVFLFILYFILYKAKVFPALNGIDDISHYYILIGIALCIGFMILVGYIVKSFGEGFKAFGNFIASVVNFALLFIVYIFGVGITAIVAKLTGKRFLKLHQSSKIKTYWIDYKLDKKDFSEYYRQF